jgi:hypothetical protein
MSPLSWLPCLVLLENHNGDWTIYQEVLYQHFTRDFVTSRPTYRGHRLRLKRHPLTDGKEATFWHMITEGPNEHERLPELRRCERICWPRPMIDIVPDLKLRVWSQTRNGEVRIAIAVHDFSYVVILAERQSEDGAVYYLPWTAFHVEREHRRKKYEKEWNKNKLP